MADVEFVRVVKPNKQLHILCLAIFEILLFVQEKARTISKVDYDPYLVLKWWWLPYTCVLKVNSTVSKPFSPLYTGFSFGLTFYRMFQTSVNNFFITQASVHVSKLLAEVSSHPILVRKF